MDLTWGQSVDTLRRTKSVLTPPGPAAAVFAFLGINNAMTQPIPSAKRSAIFRCWREGRTWEYTAQAAGVSLATVQRTFFELKGADVPRGDLKGAAELFEEEAIPPAVLADRNHRMSLVPRSIVAAIAGDPLPGYSALERR